MNTLIMFIGLFMIIFTSPSIYFIFILVNFIKLLIHQSKIKNDGPRLIYYKP